MRGRADRKMLDEWVVEGRKRGGGEEEAKYGVPSLSARFSSI